MTQAINNTPGGPKGLPIVVTEAALNARDTLRVSLSEYGGRKVIDVRKWYADGDELKPSGKGITLAIDKLPLLAEGIAAALVKARQMGLLEGTDG